MQRMRSAIGFREAAALGSLPQPESNRGFDPVVLVEQFLVSLWCGANRFSQKGINRKHFGRLAAWYTAGIGLTAQVVTALRPMVSHWQDAVIPHFRPIGG